jgi:hypothetical protein
VGLTPGIILDRETQKLWDLNAIWITESESLAENDPVYTKFVKSIVYNGNHYVVELPWKTEVPEIHINYHLAKCRLTYTLRRLEKLGMFKDYANIIQEQLKRDFIEKVPQSELFIKVHTHHIRLC